MRRCLFVGCLLSIVAGCGAEMRSPQTYRASDAKTEGVAADGAGGASGAGAAAAQAVQRRIIYNSTLDLVVEDFSEVPQQVLALRDRFGAYIADSQVFGHAGTPRHGFWKLRVPIAKFDEFVAEARGLGELRNERQEAEDVTDKYYDLDARLRNKKKQEARLIELLADRTAKLEDVVKVETEMARVREEIERLEGQLRLLENLSALATVTLKVQEVKDYVPDESASFLTRIGRAWSGSLSSLRDAGENGLLAAVVLAPWLVVLGLMGVVVFLVLRRLRRARVVK